MSLTQRTELLIGRQGVQTLTQACALVVGIGGVGSNCSVSLARAGIGTLILVDYDVVSESNINRQAFALQSTIGRSKLNVGQELIHNINPHAHVQCISMQVLPSNINELFQKLNTKPNYIIDTADLITTKVHLALHAQKLEIPYIAALGSGNKLDPQLIQFADIYETHTCRMCKAVRKQARKNGLASMQVVYSPEEPLIIQADEDVRKARGNVGTISYYPAIMGQLIASKVIRELIGN